MPGYYEDGNDRGRKRAGSDDRRYGGGDGEGYRPAKRGFGGRGGNGSSWSVRSEGGRANDEPPGRLDVRKNFYSENAELSAMSEAEIERYRTEHKITLSGSDIPRPAVRFAYAGFPREIMDVIRENKFEKPTPIQAQGWPMVLTGQNVVGIAQTGSGKTLCYLLPALLHIRDQTRLKPGEGPIALILAPTRELVQQIQKVCRLFGDAMKIRNASFYGGVPKGPQIRECQQGAEIFVATPGRLNDLLEMGITNMRRVSYVVLDEADRMLDMGFEPQIRRILDRVSKDRQTVMWSATWPNEVRNLSKNYIGNYIQVTIGDPELTSNKNIDQQVVVCDESAKEQRLADLLLDIWNKSDAREDRRALPRILIFSNTKKSCDDITWKMRKDDWPAESIHGDKSQAERDRALENFRRGVRPILMATDVAARGLDVKDVKFVINFDFPNNIEDYVHRIGRTARGSDTVGTAYSFFTQANRGLARELVKILRDSEHTPSPELLSMISSSRPAFSRYGRPGPSRRFPSHSAHGRPPSRQGPSYGIYESSRR